MPTSPAGWLDLALLFVVVLSVLVGLWRGFVFECLALAGWVVAWLGAQWLAPEVLQVLPWAALGLAPQSLAATGSSFALAFVGILLVWSLLARLVRLLLHATPLSVPDRALGAVFGLLRGGVALLALATVMALLPPPQPRTWESSVVARWADDALELLKPLLPDRAAQALRV